MHTTEEFETFRVTADLSKAVDLLIRFKVPFDLGSTVEDRKKFTQETMPMLLSHDWKHFTQTNDLPDGEFPCVVCDMGHCPYKMPPKYPHGLPIRAPYFMTLTKDQLTHLRVETGPGEPLLVVNQTEPGEHSYMIKVVMFIGFKKSEEKPSSDGPSWVKISPDGVTRVN